MPHAVRSGKWPILNHQDQPREQNDVCNRQIPKDQGQNISNTKELLCE